MTAVDALPTSLHIDTARSWRGGQSQVRYTVMGLRALGGKAALVAHPDGELFRRMSEGTDLFALSPRNEVDLASAWRLSRVLKAVKPDIVQAHDPHGVAMAATALSILSPRPRPPLVATRRIEFRIARNSFSRWKYSQVDGFVAISQAVADRLAADGIARTRITVVNEGVDVERIVRLPHGNIHAELYLPTHAPIVGNVGALVEQKGHHHLIEAAALVVREVPDARFVILGEGELRGPLEEQIKRHHLERHIFLAGFRTDVVELTKAFDVFVVSSLQEGMCTALVDAMAAGRPAVGTSVGGVPEVMGDGVTGFVVPPRDAPTMALRIVQLLKDPALRTRMGAAAVERARARFTVERMVEQTLEVYTRLLGYGRREGAQPRVAPH